MSTKIYDAYMWANGNINDLMDHLRNSKKRAMEQAIGAVCAEHQIIKLRDKMREKGQTSRYAFETQVGDILRKEFVSERHAVLDLRCDAVIYFYRKKLFIKFFGMRSTNKWCFVHGKMLDFHFQNSSDKPESVSDKGWELREKIWDEIIDKGNGTFANAGLTFSFIGFSDIWHIANEVLSRMFPYDPDVADAEKENINALLQNPDL